MKQVAIGAGLFALGVYLAIASFVGGSSDPAAESTVRHMPARWASWTARDVGTLIAAGDGAFVGEVISSELGTADLPEITPSDNATGVDKPANDGPSGIPMTTFEVRVTDPVSGGHTDGEVVTIKQIGGQTPDGVIVLEGDELLRVGETYLFFVQQRPDGAYASAPFARFRVSGETLLPLTPWANTGVAQQLGGRPVAEASAEVADVPLTARM